MVLLAGTGSIFGKKEMRILMLGLDAAGKTSKSQEAGTQGFSAKIPAFSDSLQA